jgi:signal peptidase II
MKRSVLLANGSGEWFRLHYLLNPGMAFGIRWNNEFGKLALTVFRIAAMAGIGYYLWKMAHRHAHNGFLWCMALILGGAVGNVIDSTFYGVLLNNHPIGSPTPWFHGQVIDMLFFPIFEFYWPDWVPMIGGDYFLFFSPVFNIADSSIFIGVVTILLFQRRFFKEKFSDEHAHAVTESAAPIDPGNPEPGVAAQPDMNGTPQSPTEHPPSVEINKNSPSV